MTTSSSTPERNGRIQPASTPTARWISGTTVRKAAAQQRAEEHQRRRRPPR